MPTPIKRYKGFGCYIHLMTLFEAEYFFAASIFILLLYFLRSDFALNLLVTKREEADICKLLFLFSSTFFLC